MKRALCGSFDVAKEVEIAQRVIDMTATGSILTREVCRSNISTSPMTRSPMLLNRAKCDQSPAK